MAVRTLPRPAGDERGAALVRALPRSEALVLALALPVTMIHVSYQPAFTVHLGSTSARLALSDLVVLAVGVAALSAGLRRGFAPLRAAPALWAATAALLVWILVRTRSTEHLVTAAKFWEYALLAVAVPLVLRTRAERVVVLGSLVATSAVASTIGAIQFFGVDVLGAWPAGMRQPSFLGQHDLAALSGAALGVALVALALGSPPLGGRALAWVAGAAGLVGLVLSGATAGVIGFGAAAAAVVLAAWRRGRLTRRGAGAVAAIAAVVAIGLLVLRGGDLARFVQFVGVERHASPTQGRARNIETYSQRTILAYIGMRIWQDHPLAGAGWQASGDYATYGRYVADARRRFPGAAPLAFLSRERDYGVQNGYVQALADLGAVGLVLLLATLLTALWTAARTALRGSGDAPWIALLGGAWTLVAAGVWGALGLVAGIPTDAVLWLGLGFVAAAAAARSARA